MPNSSPDSSEERRVWEAADDDEQKVVGNSPLHSSGEPPPREILALQQAPAVGESANSGRPAGESRPGGRQTEVEAESSGTTGLDALLAGKREALEAICRRFGVRRLEVFGSALEGAWGDTSDVDFLVEFDVPEIAGYADRFFGLKEALEQLLGRGVDLVVASAITNPFFRRAVEERKVLVYGD